MLKPDFSTMDRAQLCTAYNEMIDAAVGMGQSPATYRKIASFTHGAENAVARCEKLWLVVETMQADAAKPKDENRPEVSPVMGEHAAADIEVTLPGLPGGVVVVDSTKPVKYKSVDLVQKENAVTNKSKTKSSKPKAVKAKTNGKSAHGVRAGSKTEGIKKLLLRTNGCTSKEVLALTGWPSVSMNAMAKACGLKLTSKKEKGERTRYWGA
jgi:hypothetical protein